MKNKKGTRQYRKFFIWINEKDKEESFYFFFEYYKSDREKLSALKKHILSKLNNNDNDESSLRLFDFKGYEIDEEEDISDLKSNEIIFVTANNRKFNNVNFVNLFEMNEFLKDKDTSTSPVKNVLTGETFRAHKFHWNNDYRPHKHKKELELKSIQHNYCLEYMKKLEFSAHRNSIKIVLSLIYEGYLIYITEYLNPIEWVNLLEYVDKKTNLEEKEIRTIIMQVYDAIRYYNDKKLYHAQLHPKNIFIKVGKTLEVKVGNFRILGVSEAQGNKSKADFSHSVIPPEGLEISGGEINDKVDSWGLGLLIYYCFFGKFPLKEKRDSAIEKDSNLQKHNLSSEAKDVIIGLLNGKRENRSSLNEGIIYDWFYNESHNQFVLNGGRNPSVKEIPEFINNEISSSSEKKNKLMSSINLKKKAETNKGVITLMSGNTKVESDKEKENLSSAISQKKLPLSKNYSVDISTSNVNDKLKSFVSPRHEYAESVKKSMFENLNNKKRFLAENPKKLFAPKKDFMYANKTGPVEEEKANTDNNCEQHAEAKRIKDADETFSSEGSEGGFEERKVEIKVIKSNNKSNKANLKSLYPNFETYEETLPKSISVKNLHSKNSSYKGLATHNIDNTQRQINNKVKQRDKDIQYENFQKNVEAVINANLQSKNDRQFSLDKYKNQLDSKLLSSKVKPVSPMIDRGSKNGFGYKISNSVEHRRNASTEFSLPIIKSS